MSDNLVHIREDDTFDFLPQRYVNTPYKELPRGLQHRVVVMLETEDVESSA